MAQSAGPLTPLAAVVLDRPGIGVSPGPALARDLFDEAVRSGPDRLAVAAAGRTLTYRELDQAGQAIADLLVQRGIGPDMVVGVCLGSSIDRIAALVGVLKSGAGYAPVDQALPAERIAFILADSGAPICLTETRLVPILPAGGPELICLDQPLPERPVLAKPPASVGPDHLAYLVYTSGSTGRPKGVEVPHRALANLVHSWIAAFNVTPADRASPICGPGFDANVAEIWPYLCAGASLHLPDDETRLSPAQLLSWWAAHGITMSIAPTPLAEAILAEPWPADLALRYLFAGGDKLRRRPPVGWPARLMNQYGPSEAAVLVTSGEVLPGPAIPPPSIGGPFANAKLQVVDSDGRPVPPGEPGELYIGGPGLARGYRNRPDLTAERFIPDPLNPTVGAQVYRTGDRVRLRPDGGYDFLGRLDDQVKLRGYRIELGEIETVLASFDEVAAAVAVVREDQPGLARLVAYLVPAKGRTFEANDLRRRLERVLPGYMIPAAMVPIEAVPLTPNGKPDRAVLPPPRAEHFLRSAYVPPRTMLERRLAEIWSDVLAVRDVGVNDRFLDLGGHSLVALVILARLRADLGIDLSLGEFLAEPTVARLSAAVTGRVGRATPALAPDPVDWERFRDPALERADGLTPIYRFPASASQQRVWLLDQMAPGSVAYNLPLALEFTGRLDRPALARALGDLLERHAALRTVIRVTDGRPWQIVLPPWTVELPVTTPGGAGGGDPAAAIASVLREEANRPFDLGRGPLIRASLVTIGPDHHVLALTLHHVTTDGWSTEVLFSDLGACYRARLEGREPPPPLHAMRYADWTLAMEQLARTDIFAEQERYWLDHLNGSLPVLELPADQPRPPLIDFTGDVLHIDLPPAVTDRLTAIARAAGATPFVAFLAAYAVLLRRYTGHDDVVIGTPIAGRRLTGSDRTIGFLANTLALRFDLAGDPSFAAILERARDEVVRASGHADYPFDRLVERLHPRRDPSRNPIFQTLFTLNHGLPSLPDMGELTVARMETHAAASRFDLSLTVTEADGRWTAELEYATALFAPATIAQIAAHYTLLLTQLADDPNDVRGLPRLGPAERESELFDWNRTSRPFEATTVTELVARQVAATPNAIAVADAGERLSYRELDRRAEALARRLESSGVGAGDLVGLCLDRGAAIPIALLAILKTGASYLPLDPAFPADRLRYIVSDAAARLIVTETRWLDRFDPATPVCLLDQAAEPLADPTTPRLPVSPEAPAYVIYTSGSTGRPKGVAVPHRALTNFLNAMRRTPGLLETDRLLAVTTLSFDIAGLEIWLPLVTGAAVVIASREDTVDGARLAALLDQEAISVMQATPSTWRLLLEQGWQGRPGLTMLAGGEALPADLIGPLLSRGRALWNLYGPTETTIWSAVSRVRRPGPVHLGDPIDNTFLYILDEQQEPVPRGVSGELWIGGAGTSLGYWRRPDLTAERFRPDPWHADPPGLMYRTGDRVRRRRDNTLEYLGRLDTQVKVRGYRIELGEVEAALGDLAGVAQAAVVVRGGPDDQSREIVAFVVTRPGPPLTPWRAALATRLPEYMIPGRFVTVDALPTTPNGKVDRKDLATRPLTAEDRPQSRRPRTAEEGAIFDLWRELLPERAIGATDDFFAVGGHSLLGARMLAQLAQRTGVTLPLAALLTSPTIEALAARIQIERSGAAVRPIVLNPAGRRIPLVFLHGDFGGGGLYCRRLAALLGDDQPLIVLDTPREASEEGTTIEQTATAVIGLMKTVQPEGPYRLGGWCNGGLVAWDMAHQLGEAGERVEFLFLLDADAQNSHFPWARRAFAWLDRLVPTTPKVALERRSRTMIRLRYYGYRLRILRHKPLRELLAFIPGYLTRLIRRLAWKLGIHRSGEAPVQISFETADVVEWRNWLRLSTRAAAGYFPRPAAGAVSLAFTKQAPDDQPLDPTLGWSRIAPSARITWLDSDHIEAVAAALPQTAGALTTALTAADSAPG